MIFAIGKTATLRKGNIIPGGKKFEVSATEANDFRSRGYTIIEDANSEGPESSGINIPPEKRTSNIPEIYPGENSDFEPTSQNTHPKLLSGATQQVSKPMGSGSGKAKTSSKVSSKKEG